LEESHYWQHGPFEKSHFYNRIASSAASRFASSAHLIFAQDSRKSGVFYLRFFCIAPDELTEEYSSFLTEYITYGEEYMVSIRAGSADRWSEWSQPSDPVLLKARPLRPRDSRLPLNCAIEPEERSIDPFRVHDHILRFSWPAFTSFDPRTPLPVEYREHGMGWGTNDVRVMDRRAVQTVLTWQKPAH